MQATKKATMKTLFTSLITLLSISIMAQASIHEFSFISIDGQQIPFSNFAGKKILIVNTASECGFTDQYKELQEVHEKYGDRLVIIGFPANNFGQQEPGENKEIAQFCQKNYGVTFTMAAKISVQGADMNEVFKWLCQQENPDFTGEIKWNFEKFLIDEQGKLIARFRSTVKPDDKKITALF